MNAYYDDGCCRIYHADALEALREIPDESVQLVVTSPPYYGLRNYPDPNQIGLEPTPEEYVARLMEVFREVKRVLKKDGSFYLNIGDTYSGSWGHYSHEKNPGLHDHQNYPIDKPPPSARVQMKPKCMICIPERVLFAMLEDGWILRNKICWYKPNHMPSSVKDRFTTSWEYIYFFTKSPKYYFDLDAVRESHKPESIRRNEQGYKATPFKGRYQVPWEKREGTDTSKSFLYGVKKNEQMPRHHGNGPQYKLSGLGRGSRDNRKELQVPGQYPQGIHRKRHSGYYGPNGEYLVNKYGRNPGDLWEITTHPSSEFHFAIFPEKLCERPILASSKPGDIVLDPLMGSGTALVVAKKLGRKAIGIDIVESYCEIAKRRLEQISLPLI